MSYFEALEQATSGNLSDEVLNAMRRESRRGSGTSEQLQVKVNLGVALLQAGNRATKPADYNSLYQESEEIFLSVLAVDSGNEFAQENLAVVRKNRNIRKKELQGDPPNSQNPLHSLPKHDEIIKNPEKPGENREIR